MPGIPPDFVRSNVEFTSIPELWHLPKDPWEGIWQRVTGKTIRIAVLDTGIVSHPNLPTPIAAKSFISGEDVSDRNGHSTHCSGTALGRDGLGVAPEAELIIGKVLSNSGSGGSGGIAAGIRWATEQGADIISMSLGGGSSYGPTNDAIDAAWAKGIIVNCAAGNAGYAGGRNTIGWPAKYRGALCNAAYQRNGTIAGFSSGGEEVDWATPGQNIISASNRGSGYAEMSGTCLAAGTLVYTPSGPQSIEDIRPGTTVFAWKDRQMVARKVTHNHYQGKVDTITVWANGRAVRCTPEHRFLAIDRGMSPEWIEAQHLTRKHRLVVPKRFANITTDDSSITNDMAWLAGFFLGDGWLSHGNCNYATSFALKESPSVNAMVASRFERQFGKSLKVNPNGNWQYCYMREAHSTFERLGLDYPSKAKTIPSWVFRISQAKQRVFFDGYMQSDGYAKARGQGFECSSKDLIQKVAALYDYWGFKRGAPAERFRILQPPNSPKPVESHTHTLVGTLGSDVHAGHSMFKTKCRSGEVRLSEAGLDTELFSFFTPVVKNDALSQHVYDITVPDADCFVANGLIVHNSMATPFGSGLLALIVQMMRQSGEPAWTAADAVRKFFQQWCEDAGDAGKDNRFGFGIPKYEAIVEALTKDEIKWL